MASIKAITRDKAALPAALLPAVKQHIRLDGNYDDAFLTSAIARAIGWFERVTLVTVFATQWEWKPDSFDFCNGVAVVPVTPVGTWTAKDSAQPPNTITANYTLATMSTHGVGIFKFTGSYVDGLTFTLDSGYTQATLDEGILDAVLRYTAHLYEHREILVPDAQIATPGWMTDVIATYWTPRA